MNNTVKLTLLKPLILDSVMNETFQKGRYDKAADPKASAVAYVEQAGNEDYHQRILNRTLYTSLEELKTHLTDYLSENGGTTADNSISTEEEGDAIILCLSVGNRFNKGYTDSLARLCAKYIEESMLMDWWRPVNEKQSALYAQFVERDLSAIKRCFNKTAPVAPSYKYTETLTVGGSSIDIGIGEQQTVTYGISDGAIDDIEIMVEDKSVCQVARSLEGFLVVGRQLGHTLAKLYSRHNEEVTSIIHVFVTDQS